MAISVIAGKNGLIYISGTGNEIIGANAWSLKIEHDAIAYSKFGDEWEGNLSGIKRWSGSVSALHDQGAKLLSNAAVADGLVALLIYPDRTDITTYWDGDAIFSFSNDAEMGSAITQGVDFTGNGILAPCGFT